MQNNNNITNQTIIPLEIVEKLRAEKMVKTQLERSDNPTVKDQINVLLAKMKFDERVPLYVSTIKGELVFVNDGYRALVSDSESIGGMVHDARGEYKLPASLLSILNEVQLTRSSVTVEETIHIHGATRQYRSRHFPICDDHGYVIAIGRTYTDCTDQFIASNQEKSSISEERYRDFARATSDWYWEVDKSFNLTYLSNRFTAISGKPSFLMLGEQLSDIGELLNGFDGDPVECSDFMSKNAPFRDQLLVLNDQDDEKVYVYLSGVPLFDVKSGEFQGFRGAGTDVTESHKTKLQSEKVQGKLVETLNDLKDQRARLDIATKQADEALEAKSDFLAAMSHELRTPLNAIIGFAETMTIQAFGELNDQYVSYSNDIMNVGRHLLHLINDILDVAVLESGKIQLDVEDVSLSDVINGARNMVVINADKKQIDVSEVILNDDIDIHADARRVTQVFVNLLSNAVKFTPEGGTIGVRTEMYAKGVIGVTVWDTGIGIPPDQQDLVFEKFHQDRGHIYARKEEGTGLGLHISKHLAKQMGGDVLLKSKVDEGSEFTVLIPVSV
ncbi:MAG: PAS domain-containing sensor histidine kinase [Emcibacteraceae bacterium]|nr:PAS domain-containing sensor histidine kinase [Emcibacteraceae bacterium]